MFALLFIKQDSRHKISKPQIDVLQVNCLLQKDLSNGWIQILFSYGNFQNIPDQ